MNKRFSGVASWWELGTELASERCPPRVQYLSLADAVARHDNVRGQRALVVRLVVGEQRAHARAHAENHLDAPGLEARLGRVLAAACENADIKKRRSKNEGLRQRIPHFSFDMQ